MNTKLVVMFILGIALGSVVTYFLASNKPSTSAPTPAPLVQGSHTMTDMVHGLHGKTGDTFDKAFIELMIEHHMGAIDMAKLASDFAAHDEIKQMSEDIISAQQKEVNQMQQWWQEWGY